MFQQLIASRETRDFEVAMILLITMSSNPKPMGFLRVLRFPTTRIVDKDKPPTDAFTVIVVP